MSTYSSNLRLELITSGTQAGNWGNTTNTNLGTLLEGAVSGYSTVSVTSANQAFTANNGAADEARQALINLTTTTTANFAVYAPPVSKQYVIYNSSAYTATIYNSTVTGNTTAAGTGIAVLAGLTMTVWSNGTNFYSQNTQLISPTIASPTMTGTPVAPTAASGTNTTQLATTAFVTAAFQAMYPVGSIYVNAGVSTNPATLLGFGTWTAFGAGRVMVGLNASDALFDTLEETGGSKDATLVQHNHTFSATSGNMSANSTHAHQMKYTDISAQSRDYGPNINDSAQGYDLTGYDALNTSTVNLQHTHTVSGSTDNSGTSGTNLNLQPYITVAMWKRTA